MQQVPTTGKRDNALEILLQRSDVWRGHAHHFTTRGAGISTGYGAIDAVLLQSGWPCSQLIELCQPTHQAEWTLLASAILANQNLTVLLNPPDQPFVQALLQMGVDLDRLIVVEAASRTDFLGCFTEIARAASCGALVSWQPKEPLTYTDLRRCALAVAGGTGLYWVIRPSSAQQQSSPAGLRLFTKIVPSGIEVTVFKQKGWLKQLVKPLVIPVPQLWQGSKRHNTAIQLHKAADVLQSAGSPTGRTTP